MLSSLTLATVPPLKLAHESAAGAGEGLGGLFFRGKAMGEAAADTDALFLMIFWFSMFFFVLLMFLMVYWSFFKYRRRPGVPAPRSPSHNTPLEIIWTVVPSSGLLVIFLLGMWAYTERHVAYSDAIELNVKAWKWGWGVTYPNGAESQWALSLDPGGTQQVPVFVVPEDTEIALTMISQDVLHSFWIPDARVKMDVFPNRYSGYTFRTSKLAQGADYQDHWIFCAEYCGDLHSEMAAVLRVVPYGEYVDITENQWALGDLTPVQIGQRTFTAKCATCHSVDGSANIGPTWLGLFGSEVPLVDGTTVVADENFIRESILEPSAKIHEGYAPSMPPFQGLVNDVQLEGLIAYMKSLSESADEAAGEAAGKDESGAERSDAEPGGTPEGETEADGSAEAVGDDEDE